MPLPSGFTARWDFSNAASVTLGAGSEITDINDLSGNGHHLTRSATGGPVATTSAGLGVNTLTHARFNGASGRRLVRTTGNAGVTGSFTVFIAQRKQTGGISDGNADPVFAIRGLSIYVSGAGLNLWCGGGNTVVSNTDTVWTTGGIMTRQLSGSSHSFWIGNTNYLTGFSSGSGSSGTVCVGGESDTDGSDWDIGEIVVYNSVLDATARASAVDYLTQKWLVLGGEPSQTPLTFTRRFIIG